MLATIIHAMEVLALSALVLLAVRISKLSKAEVLQTEASNAQQASSTPSSTNQDHANDDESIIVKQESSLLAFSNSKDEDHDGHYSAKMESLKLAQMFAGHQLLDVSRSFHDLQKETPDWLRSAMSLYLIGAIDFIGKQGKCENKSRKELISMVLRSNLSITPQAAEAYFIEAVCREPESDNDNMVKAGALAAKTWLDTQTVPAPQRLSKQLENWGVLA